MPPPPVVSFDAHQPGKPTFLLAPPGVPGPVGRLTEVTTTAQDGTPLRSWLVLPESDGPHPLVLWIHGGPLSSWNGWSWRWNPWLMAARGWAVLLPDPALSTGYGQEMIRRGWGEWGARPYTDLMSIVDTALERPDIDGSRIAAMGGSFGGYMANWVAGHTDRFAAIVTHASLWDLDQFGADDRRGLLLVAGDDRGHGPGQQPECACRRHHDADARHPWRQGLSRADR